MPVKICEMQEAGVVNIENPSDDDLNEKLKNIVVTGYSKGGSDESAGVSIQAQKLLKSGQVLNLSVPFTKFEDESGEGYPYGDALKQAVSRLDYEVDAYLVRRKIWNQTRIVRFRCSRRSRYYRRSRAEAEETRPQEKSRNGGCRRRDKSV